jgi:hypothetical protein
VVVEQLLDVLARCLVVQVLDVNDGAEHLLLL